MAKTSRKNRARNARRKARELRAAMRGEGQAPKARNEMVMAIGRIDNFIHGGLREKPSIGARSGVSRPQEVKECHSIFLLKMGYKLYRISGCAISDRLV